MAGSSWDYQDRSISRLQNSRYSATVQIYIQKWPGRGFRTLRRLQGSGCRLFGGSGVRRLGRRIRGLPGVWNVSGLGLQDLDWRLEGVGDSGGEGCLRSGLDLASGVWSSALVLGVEELEFGAGASTTLNHDFEFRVGCLGLT